MPPAAKISVVHACAKHPPNAQVTGSSNTLVGFLPAGRVGDATACGAAIAAGAATVLINHRPAARLGDSTTHGGKLVTGHPNVLIGDTPQSFSLGAAAATGKPFCEECEKARRRLEESEREQREELEGDAEAHDHAEADSDGDEPERNEPEPNEPTPEPAGPPALDASTVRWNPSDLGGSSLEALAREPATVNARATGPTASDALRAQARSYVARSFLLDSLPTQPKSLIEGLAKQIDLESPVRVLRGAQGALPTLEVALKHGVSQPAFRAVLASAMSAGGSAEPARRAAEAILTQSDLAKTAAALAQKVNALGSKLPQAVADAVKEGLASATSQALDDVQAEVEELADVAEAQRPPKRALTLSALAIENVHAVDPALARELMTVEFGASRWEALLPG